MPFYFILSETDMRDHVTKRAILSKEIEFEESRDRKKWVRQVKIDKDNSKAMDRDYFSAIEAFESQRVEAEKERRERDV